MRLQQREWSLYETAYGVVERLRTSSTANYLRHSRGSTFPSRLAVERVRREGYVRFLLGGRGRADCGRDDGKQRIP